MKTLQQRLEQYQTRIDQLNQGHPELYAGELNLAKEIARGYERLIELGATELVGDQ